MILYHGSKNIITAPRPDGGKIHNDYGQGFYTTEHYELSCEWAVELGVDGFSNKYELNMTGLKVLDLSSSEYTILHWLTILLEHRDVNFNSPIMKAGDEFLKKNYHIDLAPFDIIKGYRADDSYFAFSRAFLANTLPVETLTQVMSLGDLGEQIFLRSKKAFDQLSFIEAATVDSSVYYPKKHLRDISVQENYIEILNRTVSKQPNPNQQEDRENIENETFLSDLMRNFKND